MRDQERSLQEGMLTLSLTEGQRRAKSSEKNNPGQRKYLSKGPELEQSRDFEYGGSRVRKTDGDKERGWARPDHTALDTGLVHLGCYNPDTTDWKA